MTKVRFAPSPTGFLHLGSARTALFNWLYARHHKGKFLLRIEDTDKERSTSENIELIYKSLKWLGLDWDDEPVLQSERSVRHQAIAQKLLEEEKAYKCFCTQEELENARQEAISKKLPPKYDGRCRRSPPKDRDKFVIRFRVPENQKLSIQDKVQGLVEIKTNTLEDFVLLRQDETPTYMLAVTTDDHDMEITNIIRGDDHLINSFKQKLIYEALDWKVPEFAHIPLIHGPDGAKLSKRHGAIGLDAYEKMGILPESMFNYLLRLGWSHGNDEIISQKQAIEWFDVKNIGKSAARFDMDKLLYLNAHYLKQRKNETLVDYLMQQNDCKEDKIKERLTKGMDGLKQRSKTLIELYQNSEFYFRRPVKLSNTAETVEIDKKLISDFLQVLEPIENFDEEVLLEISKIFVKDKGIKLVVLAQALRILLTGHTISPSVFEIMAILGKKETLARLQK